MGRLARAIIIVVVMLGFGALLFAGALFVVSEGNPIDYAQTALIRLRLAGREDELNRPLSSDSTPIRFQIEPGDTPRAIGQRLVAANLIADSELFVDYVRANDIDRELEAGTYFLNRAQSTAQIAVALTDSRSSQFPFRILEGWRLEEVAEVVDTNPYFGFSGQEFMAVVGPGAQHDPDFAAWAGLPPGASLEGFLFPDTYQLPAEVTPVMLRDILTQQFVEAVGTEIPALAQAQRLSMFEVVTLASIVQREAVRLDESPRIASVYLNRLREGMKLDADPTVQYGIGYKDGTWWPQITVADYTNTLSPYNTYLAPGLPPGPIGNPGLTAIRAVVQPEQTPYFYFRAACDGSGYHEFAVSFEEHLANACP